MKIRRKKHRFKHVHGAPRQPQFTNAISWRTCSMPRQALVTEANFLRTAGATRLACLGASDEFFNSFFNL